MTFATLVATAKNEGPYLWEWVAYHKEIGFDEIIVFQNDSDDFTHEILFELRSAGVIHYLYNRAPQGKSQVRAYIRSTRLEAYRRSKWIMALDLDEFLRIKTEEGTLSSLVAALPEADRIFINWKLFGSSGHAEAPEGLVLENFAWSEFSGRITQGIHPFKSLFLNASFERPGVHQPRGYRGTHDMVTTNGSGLAEDAFEIRSFQSTDPGNQKYAQVNHYIVRDAASFVLKSMRGSAHQDQRDIGEGYWRRRNKNQEAEPCPGHILERVRRRMAEIDGLSNGKIADYTAQALAHHRAAADRSVLPDAQRALLDACLRTNSTP